jgi:hypothetical protein
LHLAGSLTCPPRPPSLYSPSAELHSEAFALAEAVYSGTRLDRARERVVAALAASCVGLQARGAQGGALMQQPVDDAMEGSEVGSDDDGLADGTADGSPAAERVGSGGAAAAADAAWRRLREHLERCEGQQRNGYSLRVVAVDAALSAERRFCPPRWLVAPFLAPPPAPGAGAGAGAPQQRADVAGLLRAYMRHGRLEDAAALAERHVGVITRSVPSVALARTAAVCLPHGLLQELAARLQAQPGGEGARQRLAALVGAERAAAERQTAVIAQIFA